MRKGELARQRVLDAVVDVVAGKGLANLAVSDVGEAAGMSAGHVLYYFDSKDTLFVEALKHMEAQLDAQRAAVVASTATPRRRLHRYLELYLPADPRDARWALWIEVWNRSVTDKALRALQEALDARWQDDLAAIIAAGIDAGEFSPAVRDASAAIAAVLDGLAVRELTGARTAGPASTAAGTRAAAQRYCDALLGVPPARRRR